MRQALYVILIFSPFFLFAQQNASDTVIFRAPSVEKFDSAKIAHPVKVYEINIYGNKVTKEHIITRELTFSLYDSLYPNNFAEKLRLSRRNLYNTSLFNFVEITYALCEDEIYININVIERWYLWPVPYFELAETNFNTWWLTKDLTRANYGMFLTRENFRGRKEAVRLIFQTGYTQRFAMQYNVPYLNKKQTLGLKTTISYNTNKELTYGTTNNKRNFYRDTENPVRTEFYVKTDWSYRRAIYNIHNFQIKYNYVTVQDSLLKLSNDYFPNNKNFTQYILLSYYFKHDKRDVQLYPLQGHFFDFEIVKSGIGVLKNEPDLLYFTATVKKFHKFSEVFYWGSMVKTKHTFQEKMPYYTQRGLGYGMDNVRGYEYYVVDGQSWFLNHNNFKTRLVAPRVRKIPFLPSNRFNTIHFAFYWNVYCDFGYVNDRMYASTNPLGNTWMIGYGTGIDFVTFYDFSIRFEYSFNKLGERGFFLNFASPI